MKFGFYREKKIHCGTFMDVSVFPYTHKRGEYVRGKRSKKRKESAPKQKNLNEKNSIRYFRQLVNTNFCDGGYHMTLTYKPKFKPTTLADLYKEVANFLRRLRGRMKSRGVLKYIIVSEYGEDSTGELINPHHHLLITSDVPREVVEECWERKKRGRGKGEPLGFIRSSKLLPDEAGLTGLAKYLSKQPNRKKRWSSSQNLKKPESRTRDRGHGYSRREVERIAKEYPGIEYWEKKYPGYTLAGKDGFETPIENEFTGWSLYVRLRKLE